MNFLFLYAAETSGKEIKNKWKTYIPACIEVVVFSLLFILVTINPAIHERIQTTFFWNLVSLASASYIIVMCILIIKVVWYHRKILGRFYAKTRFKSMLWLGIFCALCIVFNILAYIKLNYLNNEYLTLIFDIMYLTLMYYITIASLVQINIINTTKINTTQENTCNLRKIYAIVKRHMEVDKAYLDPNLNLSKISRSVALPQRNISKAINAIENKNLNSFINSYRIEEFKKLLRSNTHQKYSISAIADEVGFNSRASFYKNFKDIVGESPTAYVKNISN
ncbi:helix-turn-helix domain-containing protein [Aquimarina sp. 2-A2]|uniref:helix-turn-helix domain-containing protein n=1 Tax=Aquimarina sp. 2-A2 TaxID=3382644 RepID=UPI00387EF3A5